MTALTAERDTQRRKGDNAAFPVAAASKILAGAIVALSTATGYAAKGSTATTLSVVGIAKETVDNTAGANGDLKVPVDRDGWFRVANSAAGDLIAAKDIGAVCYLVDDQTVALTSGGATRSVAGRIRDVDASGVWIEFLA
jgi:hypothetical protein